MSQVIGNTNFKTRIPTLSDDASIEEALRVYHYGVDNWESPQPVPSDSIEGHFQDHENRIIQLRTDVDAIPLIYLESTSSATNPNVIIPQNKDTIPLTIKGVATQTASLQEWQNISGTPQSAIFSNGAASFLGYVSIGTSVVKASTTGQALSINIGSATDKGIIVKGSGSQTASLQDWLNGSTTVLSVSPDGAISSTPTATSTIGITLKGASGQTANFLEVKNSSNTIITSINNAGNIKTTSPTDGSNKVRNITTSTQYPGQVVGNDSDTANGDIWLVTI